MRPTELIERTAQWFGVDSALLRSARRSRRVSHARQAAAWVLRQGTDLSLVEIGELLNREHTTVIHAVRAVEDRRRRDWQLAQRLAQILDQPTWYLDRRDPAVAQWLQECGL